MNEERNPDQVPFMEAHGNPRLSVDLRRWRWRKGRSLRERLHGIPGAWQRIRGTHCGATRPAAGLALSCDKRRGHVDGVCEDRAWIGGYK